MRLKVILATTLALVALLGGSAHAAEFVTTPPAHSESGAGPFLWSFKFDSEEAQMSEVAYKVSTESEWHDCS